MEAGLGQAVARTTIKLQINTSKWHTKLNVELKRRLNLVGRMMKSYFYAQLTGPRTGNTYRVTAAGWINRHGLTFTYTASAPHEYPAEKTGQLRRSIRYVTGMSTHGPYLAIGVVGPALEYARELENPSSKTYRPFLRRAMIERESDIKATLKKPFGF